jgi:hypothetical protein
VFHSAGAEQTYIRFSSSDTLQLASENPNFTLSTTQVFRDVSSWYHIVVTLDTTQGTESNRIKMYVNGSQVTSFSGAYPSQNTDLQINTTNSHTISSYSGTAEFYNGYLTEVNFIDGQALTPSSFGETDSATGVWKPKAYTGTYGTNGFELNFSDNSNNTAATLGKDYSGNGNNWTPNNFSVTAGAGNDSLVDSPTAYGTDTGVGGSVRGNYATWNPLYGSAPTLTNGNLDATTNITTAYGTVSVTSGKWYWEILVGNASYIGVMDSTYIKSDNNWSSQAIAYVSNGNKYNGTGSAYGASYTTNDIIGVALDMDAGTIVFYKNGSSQGTAFSSGIAGKEFRPFVYSSTSGTQTANFGQRAFAYTAPSGFKALCTTNLPTPTIGATSTTQANDYFNTVLYTGTGSSLGVTGVGFQPDWVWIKERNAAADHGLYDAVRGVQKQLESNTTTAETTETTGLTAFGSDGFTVGALAQLNTSADTYVAWNWNAGGSNATNTSGTITSTVRANTTSGFSIVTYTGTGSNATVGHGLGVAPSMIIGKRRNGIADWMVGHSGVNGGTTPFNYYLVLNSTAAQSADSTAWNNTAPTSTVFSLGSGGNVNSNTATNVMYCFAPVAGYSAFGSYTGNGAADGPFVYTNFRPRYLLIKVSSGTTNDWIIWDSARNTYNTMYAGLYADLSIAENAGSPVDILSNGFKIRNTGGGYNTSSATYIYAAFAESPFKYALAR